MDVRIDLIGSPAASPEDWAALAQGAEAEGFGAVLCPDVPQAGSVWNALRSAADASVRLRVGTHVVAMSLHEVADVVAAAEALHHESDRRLDLGLGVGRPAALDDALAAGRPVALGELRRRMAEVAESVRSWTDPPSVTVAASGPRGLELGGRIADSVALALPPTATREDVTEAVEMVRRGAGDRRVRIAVGVTAIGDQVPAHFAGRLRAADLIGAGALGVLPDDTAAAADVVREWAADLGVTRLLVDAGMREAAAPLARALAD